MPGKKRVAINRNVLPEKQRKRIIKKIVTAGDLRLASRKLGLPVRELRRIRDKLIVKRYAGGDSLEHISQIFNVSKQHIMRILKTYRGKRSEEAKALRRRLILEWAKKQPKESLAFGKLFRTDETRLREIIYAFSRNAKEAKENPMQCYERFLAELGLNRGIVGMRRRSAGSKEEIKKRLLEALSKPRSTASLMYPANKKAKITRGIASNYVVYSILRELVKSGEVKKTKIFRKVYYFRPGQEYAVERIRERAVAYALHSLKQGRKSLRFTREDAKLAVLMRLKEPMIASELHWIKTTGGDKIRLCSEAVLNSAISSLIEEGRIHSKRIGNRIYYFKPEQRKQIQRLIE